MRENGGRQKEVIRLQLFVPRQGIVKGDTESDGRSE